MAKSKKSTMDAPIYLSGYFAGMGLDWESIDACRSGFTRNIFVYNKKIMTNGGLIVPGMRFVFGDQIPHAKAAIRNTGNRMVDDYLALLAEDSDKSLVTAFRPPTVRLAKPASYRWIPCYEAQIPVLHQSQPVILANITGWTLYVRTEFSWKKVIHYGVGDYSGPIDGFETINGLSDDIPINIAMSLESPSVLKYYARKGTYEVDRNGYHKFANTPMYCANDVSEFVKFYY